MPSQVIFLFDLDQSLPLLQLDRVPSAAGDDDSSPLLRDLADLKHSCLRLLASHCRLHGVHGTKQEVVNFAFRFYSSTGFFGPRADASSSAGSFEALSEESYDRLSSALSEHFERLLETSKTNQFDCQALAKHLWSAERKSESFFLRKALEEIAILYDWDSPNLHSPVKGRGKEGSQNVIYVFTKFPSTRQELCNFFSPGQAQVKLWSSREIYQDIFGKAAAKNILTLLKGDSGVVLRLVDTSPLNRESGESADKAVIKEAFGNSLKHLKGGKLICLSSVVAGSSAPLKCFEEWYVPQTKPFAKYAEKIAERERSEVADVRLLKLLQKSYHPKTGRVEQFRPGKRKAFTSSASLPIGERKEKIPRRFSDESVASQVSKKSDSSKNPSSRGVEMLRLSRTVESRRLTRRESCDESAAAKVRTAVEDRGKAIRLLEAQVESFIGAADSDQLVNSLMRLQHEALSSEKADLALACLAEVTVSSLLRHLEKTERLKTTVEEIMGENFLVSPHVVGNRKTSLVKDGRVRDHKLQVLYRFELHWILASQVKQKEFEAQILLHLHQISIWDAPVEMLGFLQGTVTSTYYVRQPELLCIIFEELNLTRPKELNLLFSPSKSSRCSSIAPSSVLSAASDISFSSKQQPSSKLPGDETLSKQVSEAQQAKMEKLQRRLQGIDNLRQINLISKKDKGKQVKPITGSRMKFSRVSRRSDKSGLRNSTKKTKESSSLGHKAKRNLCFDIAVRKSPRKKLTVATPQKATDCTTPRKQAPSTPRRLTPNKRPALFVPETPDVKVGRRKSDGTTAVQESPDLGAFKYAKVATPRTMRVRDSLRRQMFYPDDQEKTTSRNIKKTEENLHASSAFLSRSISCAEELPKTTKADLLRRQSSALFLFPHLMSSSLTGPSDSSRRSLLTPTKTRSLVEKTPTKSPGVRLVDHDVFPSPGRRVSFNMKAQPPTPKSSGDSASRGILKTPIKDPESLQQTSPLVSPGKVTPAKIARHRLEYAMNATTPPKIQESDIVAEALTSPRNVGPVSDLVLAEEKEELLSPGSPQVPDQAIPSGGDANFHLLPLDDEDFFENSTDADDSASRLNDDQEDESRPRRVRSLVNRFGIDDITLSQVYSPEQHKKKALLKASPPPASLIQTSPSPRPKKKRLRSSRVKRNLMADHQVVFFSLVMDDDTELMTDSDPTPLSTCPSAKGQKASAKSDFSTNSPEKSSEDWPPQGPLKSPGKFWSVATIRESTHGGISIKMNRRKKPDKQHSFLRQRFNRSTCQETGISPNKMWQLISESPPMKKAAYNVSTLAAAESPSPTAADSSHPEKENVGSSGCVTSKTKGTEMRVVLRKLKQKDADPEPNVKYTPMTSMGIYNLTKSPLLDHPKAKEKDKDVFEGCNDPSSQKRRRVNKKLYADVV